MRDFQVRAQAGGIADGRGPQDGQIRTLLAFRGSLRSEADAGARVLRRVERPRREGTQALGRVRAAGDGEAGGPEAQGADGPQPGDGRSHQDPREDRRQGENREAAEGRGPSTQIGRVVETGSGGVSYRPGPWARSFLRTALRGDRRALRGERAAVDRSGRE